MENSKKTARNAIEIYLTPLTSALTSCMTTQANELIQQFDAPKAQE